MSKNQEDSVSQIEQKLDELFKSLKGGAKKKKKVSKKKVSKKKSKKKVSKKKVSKKKVSKKKVSKKKISKKKVSQKKTVSKSKKTSKGGKLSTADRTEMFAESISLNKYIETKTKWTYKVSQKVGGLYGDKTGKCGLDRIKGAREEFDKDTSCGREEMRKNAIKIMAEKKAKNLAKKAKKAAKKCID
jgi:hypothetical protein